MTMTIVMTMVYFVGIINARESVDEIVGSSLCRLSNSAENVEKPLRATLLAEPVPGAVAQGIILVIANQFSGL